MRHLAPGTRRLLIEQPGPWGRDRLRQSRLDPVLGAALAARCADAGVRPVLIRTRQRRDHGVPAVGYLLRPGSPRTPRNALSPSMIAGGWCWSTTRGRCADDPCRNSPSTLSGSSGRCSASTTACVHTAFTAPFHWRVHPQLWKTLYMNATNMIRTEGDSYPACPQVSEKGCQQVHFHAPERGAG